MTGTKTFPIADVLSVVPGYLVAPDGMPAVYRVLNWMTGDDLLTHQLPRALKQAEPYMVAQHPWLAEVQVPNDRDDEGVWIAPWVAEQMAAHGPAVALEPIPAAQRVVRDPMAEAVEVFGSERVIGVES